MSIIRVITVSAIAAFIMVISLAGISSSLDTLAHGTQFGKYLSETDSSAVSTLFATAAQIAGVFLGLYFPALSVVASTSCRNVPPDLRRIVVEERVGSVYLKTVAFTGAASMYALGLQVLGFNPGRLNSLLVSLLSGLSILSFVVLGLRAFTFFDPGSIAGYLSGRILEAAKAATPEGYGWSDRSLQAHQQRLADDALVSLHSLVDVTASSSKYGRGLGEIGRRTLATLTSYSRIKSAIPPGSCWFERVPRHESWLSASSTSFELGVSTGTALPPKLEPHLLWAETSLNETLAQTLHTLLKREDFREAAVLIQNAQSVLDELSGRLELDTVLDCSRQMSALVPLAQRIGTTASDLRGPRRREEELLKMAIMDGIAAFPCAIIAGIGRGAQQITPKRIQELAERRLLTPESAPLKESLPALVRQNLEFFGKAIQFEKDVERDIITTDWFVAHHVARIYCLQLQRILEELISLAESTYGSLAKVVEQASFSPEMAVLVFQRGREACDKLRYHGAIVSATVKSLDSLRHTFGEQAWAAIDAQNGESRITALQRKLNLALAKIAPTLSTDPHTGDAPDSLGYACTVLGSESFAALLSNDTELFDALFKPYLLLSLQAYDRVKLELASTSVDTQLTYAVDILLDVADVCGYAYLIDHSSGGGAWKIVKTVFDSLLQISPNPERLLNLLLAADEYRTNRLMVMSPRDMLRGAWEQTFDRHMQSLGLAGDRYGSGRSDLSVRTLPIDSLAHTFLRRNRISDNSRDVFFAAYVALRSEVSGRELPKGTKELIEGQRRLEEWRREARDRGSGPLGPTRFF